MAPHRYELRGEIGEAKRSDAVPNLVCSDSADLGKFISPLLASPGDQVVLMAVVW